jgi:two-component system phosphate regulon sensor histidine kinase PhoR
MVEGIGLSLADISELLRLERARQDMVANLSHELRTPLTSLRLLVDTLISPTGKNPEVAKDLIKKMASEIDTLEQISQEMLDLAAIESGRQVVRLVPERLTDIVGIPLARLEDQAVRKNVSLLVAVAPDMIVLADRDQASRAVLNVLHNAIKFSPSGGMVRVEADEEVDQRKIVLRVQDSGEGIPPAELARIFERFYRGDRARQTPGTGLGLAIARHIMQAHGGRIWADNQVPPQSGAVVYLEFESG